ncbi:MAG: hypothetical protein ACYDCQ_10505, partial [Dehalococcoidia bacterium]
MAGHGQPVEAASNGVLRLRIFIAHSLAWVEVMLGSSMPQISDRLVEWRTWTWEVYADEQAPVARQFFHQIGTVIDAVPAWSKADVDAVHAATWRPSAAGADSSARREHAHVNIERYGIATAGITA